VVALENDRLVSWAWQGKVVHVTDGDTIVVLTEDKEQVSIRLYGIDTPESRQPFGSKATRYVRDIAALEIVEIDEKGTWTDMAGQ
jgi:micrococcal nuclease